MATKFINLNNLATFLAKLKTLFVAKIRNAGDSTFSGAYTDLTGKPAIGGKEIASGNQTAASLGLATPADVTTAANNARAGAVNDIKNLGYQTAANVDAKVNAAKTELQNSLGSAFRAKGSTMFASLPAPHPPPRATCGTSQTSSPPPTSSSTAQARPCPPAPTSSPWPSPPATPPS